MTPSQAQVPTTLTWRCPGEYPRTVGMCFRVAMPSERLKQMLGPNLLLTMYPKQIISDHGQHHVITARSR
jgi:hypothetical protein